MKDIWICVPTEARRLWLLVCRKKTSPDPLVSTSPQKGAASGRFASGRELDR